VLSSLTLDASTGSALCLAKCLLKGHPLTIGHAAQHTIRIRLAPAISFVLMAAAPIIAKKPVAQRPQRQRRLFRSYARRTPGTPRTLFGCSIPQCGALGAGLGQSAPLRIAATDHTAAVAPCGRRATGARSTFRPRQRTRRPVSEIGRGPLQTH
jgi:hypothetical protein